MRRIGLYGTSVETTCVGYGCAGLFRAPSARERRRLLEIAYEAGIRHFDVAPMYGLGHAESEVGRFTRRRDDVTTATKFGITPTPVARGLARIQGPGRRLLAAAPGLAARARTAAPGPSSGLGGSLLYAASGYDAAAARAGLESSLRAMRADHVDVFLLHDPQPRDVRSLDVRAYLERAREAGLIRAWGVAGEPAAVAGTVGVLAERAAVVQVRDDILLPRERSSPGQGRITFGALGRAVPFLLDHLRATPSRRGRWSAQVGADCGVPEVLASFLLRDALERNPAGVVLFSSTCPERIWLAATVGERGTSSADEGLEAFRRLVTAELPVQAESGVLAGAEAQR